MAMILRLHHQRPDGEVDTYHLKSGRRYHIGRGSACEVRILDLKLSRKHCAIDYSEGEWRVTDLCSTNGCKVDGDQIVGSTTLRKGSTIEMGQTTLNVHRVLADDEWDTAEEHELVAAASAAPAIAAAAAAQSGEAAQAKTGTDKVGPPPQRPAPSSAPWGERREATAAAATASASAAAVAVAPAPAIIEQEPLPPGDAPKPEHRESEWEPQPASASTVRPTEALELRNGAAAAKEAKPSGDGSQAAMQPTSTTMRRNQAARVQPQVIRAGDDQDVQSTMVGGPAPAAPAPAAAPAAAGAEGTSDARTFFITVLGRRVGPLSRAEARDLKARELKGVLSAADLVQYPAA